jgi:hypothetical protein
MCKRLFQYLADDHRRLENILDKAAGGQSGFDLSIYDEFRKGLLRHIGIEERIVIPAIRNAGIEARSGLIEQIRLDHGAIAALMVPPPNDVIITVLRHILSGHNGKEEGPDGLYDLFESAAASQPDVFHDRMESTPGVPVMPLNDAPGVWDAVVRAVERAGYEMTAG